MRRNLLICLAVVLALPIMSLTACSRDEEEESPTENLPQVSVLTIEPGLQQEIIVTGEVQAQKSARFTAEFVSDVQEVLVKAGDPVSEGDLLLKLTAENVQAQFATARETYNTAYQNLEQTRINNQRNVESARISLEAAKTNLDTLLQKNTARKRQAEETLKSTTINLDLSLASAQTNLENQIASARITGEQAVLDIDRILEISNDRDDFNFIKEVHIGVRDPTFHYDVEIAYGILRRTLNATDYSYDAVMSLLEETNVVLSDVLITLGNSITGVDYPETTHNQNIATITNHQGSVSTAMLNMESSKRSLETARKSSGNTSQVLIDAQALYDATIADLDAAEANARRDVQKADIAYQASQASANVSDVSARSTLTSRGGDVDQARINADKLQITAPFAGTVADVAVRENDEILVGDYLLTVEDATSLKIIAYVAPQDAPGIRPGQVATLVPGGTAIVTSVAPSADPVTKKVKVELRQEPSSVQAGQFVEVKILSTTDTDDNRIYAPVTAVHIKASEVYVWGIESSDQGTTTKKIPVTIGTVRGSSILIESGLRVGDRIILDGGRRLKDNGIEVSVLQL